MSKAFHRELVGTCNVLVSPVGVVDASGRGTNGSVVVAMDIGGGGGGGGAPPVAVSVPGSSINFLGTQLPPSTVMTSGGASGDAFELGVGAPPGSHLPPDELEDYRYRALQLTAIAGLGRLPQISMPLGRVDGCPVGLSLIAGRGGDEMLIDLACALDQAS